MTKNERKWNENYELMKAYILENKHLPNKRRVENRGLLNWWKYNQKLIRGGKLDDARISLLMKLDGMRDKK